MIEATHTFELPVPVDTAFAFIADPRNDSQWQSACDGVDLVDALPLSAVPTVGSRYRICFNFLSRKMNFVGEITESTAPNCYAFQVVEGPFIYSGQYQLSPHGDGTRVQWTFRADPGRFFGVIPAVLLRKVLLAQVERDVRAMRQHLTQPAVADVVY